MKQSISFRGPRAAYQASLTAQRSRFACSSASFIVTSAASPSRPAACSSCNRDCSAGRGSSRSARRLNSNCIDGTYKQHAAALYTSDTHRARRVSSDPRFYYFPGMR